MDVLDTRCRKLRAPADEGNARRKIGAADNSAQRIAEWRCGQAQRKNDLCQFLKGRRHRPILEEIALSRQRIEEETPGSTYACPAIARRIPDHRSAWSDVVQIRAIRSARHAGVARIDEACGSVRKHRRLLSRMERVQPIASLDVR